MIVLLGKILGQSITEQGDLRAQSQQVIDPKPRAAGPRLCEQIRLRHAGPGGSHRAQFALRIEIHHPIFAPIIFARRQNELRPA